MIPLKQRVSDLLVTKFSGRISETQWSAMILLFIKANLGKWYGLRWYFWEIGKQVLNLNLMGGRDTEKKYILVSDHTGFDS